MASFARSRSFSVIASQSGAFPISTTSRTRLSSNLKWSWRSTPSFFGRKIFPVSGSSSPARIFMNVVFPAPFGPVRP